MASTTATAAAATPAMPSTDEAWKLAQKLRAAIVKELEHVQKGGRGTNELARFEKVEKLMENYRLACLQTIWPDMRAANEKNAEDALWHTHTLVTKTYRKVLGRLQGDDNVVLRRKVEKLYAHYLKTAQYFYRGYLQRVCARYDMKDLKRIARRADLQEMPLPDKEKVDASAAQLEDIVKRSCHKTLIYLGDLSRYRTLLRAKDPKWDGALAYYLLANELIPESGHGYHQCGVIYVETGDHLQVVYHLYRALACDLPHPNASTNLDLEFRELQKRKDITSKHALVTWFVKLHAFYSQGKDFTERKELEREVDHRLGLAMKSGKGYDSDLDLLKIVLINITAYVAAQDKVAKNWTDEGSRSCQFLLLLNLRTINAIARLIGEEITDVIKRKDAEAPVSTSVTASQTEPPTKFTPAFNRILPLLRVYMAWLCSYGSQLVEFRPHLEPQFGAMCVTLSNTLSLLFELLGGDQQLGNPVSWRFPEDEITMGIRCLNGPDLHDGCQLYYDAFTRKPKPRREDVPDANGTDDDVSFTRALDVLLCGLDLSEPESKFPFTTSTVTKGARELTTFVYLEGGKPGPIPNPPPVQHMTPVPVPASTERNLTAPVLAPSPCESNELSENRDFYGPDLRNNTGNNARNGPVSTSIAPAPTAPVSEFPIERQMFNILNEFINPPESAPAAKPETPSRPVARTSPYGMGSASAAETFGARASGSSGPGSAAGGKVLPTLPWEYFYKPSANPALQSSGTNGLAAGWAANGRAFSRPTSSGNGLQLGIGATAGSPLARQAQQRYDSREQSRLLEEQEDILRSLDLESVQTSQPRQSHDTRGGWPAVAAQSSSSVIGTASHSLQQQSTWLPPASPWQTTHGQNPTVTTTTGGVPNSPFSTLNFSTNSSSIPAVNSPWGVPSHGAFARDWPDARQPRTGVAQQPLGLDIWGDAMGQQQQLAVGESSGGTWTVRQQQGMPKR
ncbi:hypothetical protein MYCTH_2305083 [Thermothelomyces thermophilus ATCC 42464]|uniref:Nonsense-mediated mRNA decay factor n=1 Tax=Thermothelomyces thermophilus (strain ATCC 42464 / BCRC 31852 / DSM 1799) TaxID=573729 RepID=G2QBY1_THET4|nr:uncharacterized protein MYCTH_2305083 [Thermothelomyces thermophilus ATCC 42464]AEO58063.1 hypothetical protein MYCTH_2305083 [Thermothelomyces thermophilus ATCC 42464]